MKKKYVVDTNVLLDDENAIKILRNGEENEIFIPNTVLKELDLLKKDNKIKHKVYAAIRSLDEYKDIIKILDKPFIEGNQEQFLNDELILLEIKFSKINDLILVSNDLMFRLRAYKEGINSEPYKTSMPFKAESQKYQGFIEEKEQLVNNCFFWKDGKLYFNEAKKGEKLIDYENVAWKIKPKTVYQNAALELLLNDDINLVTIQSEAGFGKTFISLAAAFQKVLFEKKYKKIFIIKPNIEIGESLGFLPGDLNEKMYPYIRPIQDLINKLHEIQSANKLFKKESFIDDKSKKGKKSKKEITILNDDDDDSSKINTRKLEYLPINFLRGMNIDDAFVIIDEVQNLDKNEIRTALSRLGDNVKCVCVGDVRQVDREYLNTENNGLNWIVKIMKDDPIYGHIVLKGNKSRGPIPDALRKRNF